MADTSEHGEEGLAELSDTLSTLAGIVLGEETLDAVLELIVSLAVSAIPDVYGASVSLARGEGTVTANATSEQIRELDALQYRTSGPCVDAIHTGEIQHAIGEGLPARWPEFGSAATAAGVASMLSTPLAARTRTVGALNLYALAEDTFGDAASHTASVFAGYAGAVLANAATYADSESTNANLLDALATRQVIGQAVGIIMAQEHCGSDGAFDILRRASQHANVKLRDIAAEYVRSTEPAAPDAS